MKYGTKRGLPQRPQGTNIFKKKIVGRDIIDCDTQDGFQRKDGWYLSLMAPNTKGPKFAWLDPSRLYCNSQALSDCVKDLLKPFKNETIDLVAGMDAMGFILGSAVATTLGKGFLAIRKAGHLCVQTDTQEYTDYSGREKVMEVRLDVLKPGHRVLIVDQWIETGGTMQAAIKLLENQGAIVVGIAAVAIENSEGGKWLKENYKYSHCIPKELQAQIDNQYMESFETSVIDHLEIRKGQI